MTIQASMSNVTVESVAALYEEHARYDNPAYFADGGENPLAGRCRVVPADASYYIMVQPRDERKVAMARAIMKGLAGNKEVHEVLCEKHEVNFNMFSPAGPVAVMWV